MRRRLGRDEDADLWPGVVGASLSDQPPACSIGSGEAGEKQRITQRGQMVLGHARRIGHVDGGAGRSPMLRQERRNV